MVESNDKTIEPTMQEGDDGDDLSLLVVGEDTVQRFRLPARGEVTIGRGEGVGLLIGEPWISRRHAILHVGEKLRLEDLGSANGTRVRDVRLASGQTVEIASGDVIELGSTTLIVGRARAVVPPRRMRSKSHFQERLADECVTALKLQSSFAIVRVRATDAAAHDQVHAAVVSAARLIDVLTMDAPGEYTMLLARATGLEVDGVVGKIGHPLRARGLRVDIGVASYPQDGRVAESLLAIASERRRPWEATGNAGAIVVTGARMLQVHALLSRIAGGTAHVLLRGESGVGKGVLAARIHELSSRAKGPFFRMDCAAVSEDLAARELEGARGGTIFLEDVSQLTMSLQERLVHALTEAKPADVRVVSATTSDLAADVKRGTFREDLLALLTGAELQVPPLRERKDEIPELGRQFVLFACETIGREKAPALADDALALLQGYAWPGNVRELRNVILRAVPQAVGDTLGAEHLPSEKLTAAIPAPGTHLRTELEEVERKRILAVLARCAGNQSKAAKLLGISRNTLIARLNAYGVARPRGGGG